MAQANLEKANGSSRGGLASTSSISCMAGNANLTAPHVCIVGAGISGLRCADILMQKGIKVTILEARDRIGGRICQSNQLGYPIDLGPQWIHTSGANPLLKIAKEAKVPFHSWNEKINLYNPAGELIDGEKAASLSDVCWSIIDEAFHHSVENEKTISPDESLYDFISKTTEEKVPDPEDRKLVLGMAQMWGDYVGDAVDRQSLKYVWMEQCCGGEELIVTSTFDTILNAVAAPALAGAEIRLLKKVVNVSSSSPDQKVSITTSDGQVEIFDEVVMTTPLGWNKDSFSHPLSDRIHKAIDAISVGHLEKIYMTFPRAFWLGSGGDEISSTEFPAYTNWLSPSYASDTNPHAWPQEAWNLAAYAPPNSHPTLLFYIYGACSAHITSTIHSLSTDPSAQHVFLTSFFHPYFSRLPHYDPENSDCVPKASLATDWYHDEFAGYGSYCNFQIGIADAAGHVKTLRLGEGRERGIWFAGEHTAPFEECGTATGAFMSGEAVAGKILDKWGLEINDPVNNGEKGKE